MSTDVDDGAAREPNRRTILRRAAAAGALAWTAPAIIDSLASPAAAQSVSGCSRAEFELDTSTGCGTYVRVTADNGTGCTPSFWNNVAEFPDTITVQSSFPPPNGPCLYTVSITGSNGCVIDVRSIARTDQGNNCVTGTLSTNCQKLYFSPGFQPDRFKILVACAGSVCSGGTACSS
jgi:hypothetical protein